MSSFEADNHGIEFAVLAFAQRIQFRLDSNCPVGASLYQKIIIVDDAIAFSGHPASGGWPNCAEKPRDACAGCPCMEGARISEAGIG
jgi:hypothetical protein